MSSPVEQAAAEFFRLFFGTVYPGDAVRLSHGSHFFYPVENCFVVGKVSVMYLFKNTEPPKFEMK